MGPSTTDVLGAPWLVSVSALSDHLMGHKSLVEHMSKYSVSVSALSDHLMGHPKRTRIRNASLVSVSALSDHLMGPIISALQQFARPVSVSALSDHLMGHPSRTNQTHFARCFSIRSFGSFDGTSANFGFARRYLRFSIRSFGSFDGTLTQVLSLYVQSCFSIRSFGSFDGTSAHPTSATARVGVSVSALSDHLMGRVGIGDHANGDVGFQYPLFRII